MAAEPQRKPYQKPASKANITPQNGRVDERLHNTQVERAALGALLLDNRLALSLPEWIAPNWLLADAAETVDTSMPAREPLFFSRANQAIFGAIVRLVEREQPFDLTVLCEELGRISMLEAVGGAPYLISLEDDIVSLAQVPTYFHIILDKWRRRYLLRNAESIAKSAIDGPVSGALRRLETEVIETLEKSANGRLHLMDLDEIMATENDPKANILGDHVIELAEPTVIVGPPGIGKSRLVLQLACDILMGCDQWCQTIPITRHDVRIAMIQTENSGARLQRELKRQLLGCEKSQREAVLNGLRIMVPTSVEDRVPTLEDPAVESRLSRALAAFQPDIVIFDPLSAFFAGENENDAVCMRQTVAALQRIAWAGNPQAAVVILHHSRSGRAAASAAVGWDRGAYGRGSKALTGMARAQVNVAPGSAESSDVLVISCGKCSNGREFQPFAVRLDHESMLYHREENFDFDEWQEEVSRARSKARVTEHGKGSDLVIMIMRDAGATPENQAWIKKADLAKRIEDATGCRRSHAYRPIERALKDGVIMESVGSYQLTRKGIVP